MFSLRRARVVRGKSAARRFSEVGLRSLRTWLIGGLLAVAVTTYVYLPEQASLPQVTADPPPPAPRPPAAAPVGQSPLDEPLRLLGEAAQAYQGVRDYTCTLIKQERIRGQLQPEHVMQMKFRNQPFSVYMRWFAPKQFANQEVCYVQGRNQDKMRVHASGVLIGALGWVSVDPRDPKAMEHSRHTINEAGIGNLIERMRADWARDRQIGKTQARIAEYEYNRRPCIRIEVIHTEWTQQSYCGRVVLYLDKETRLPVRTECYDFQRQGGTPGGDLLECFSYVNMQRNVGLTDNDFNY